MARNDERQNNNPTIGLKIWGPLIPASDCKPCFATLIGLQLGAGALLWAVPGRRPPPTRGKWANRLVRSGGVLAGTYLIFMASMEITRFVLPYEPWVEDAKKARQREDVLRVKHSRWDPREWRYQWFGPSNYRACPWKDWKERTLAFLDRADRMRPEFEQLISQHEDIAQVNEGIARAMLERIRSGTLEAPDMTVAEMEEQLRVLPDFGDDFEQEVYDEIDLRDTDLWEYVDEEPIMFQSVVMPRSTIAFLDGVQIPEESELRSQSVNYTPMPQRVKKF